MYRVMNLTAFETSHFEFGGPFPGYWVDWDGREKEEICSIIKTRTLPSSLVLLCDYMYFLSKYIYRRRRRRRRGEGFLHYLSIHFYALKLY